MMLLIKMKLDIDFPIYIKFSLF